MNGKIRIRTASRISLLVTGILSALCLTISLLGVQKYTELRNITKEMVNCQNVIQSLQSSSNTLTRQVRLATMTGNNHYVDTYFTELSKVDTYEEALQKLSAYDCNQEVLDHIEKTIVSFKESTQKDFYALALVETSLGKDSSQWPASLQSVKITEQDRLSSRQELLDRAKQSVLSAEYASCKSTVSEAINSSSLTLFSSIQKKESRAASIFMDIFRKLIVCIALLAFIALINSFMIKLFVVDPLIHYNNAIQHGTIHPVTGATELQMVARTYNHVYEENKQRQAIMQHQAETDPLTNILNRGSFDRILQLYEKDKQRFALLLLDIDAFKQINDTYGHATGDEVIKQVAFLLSSTFRAVDHVCRIGGDEFAVILVEMTSAHKETVIAKIHKINQLLSQQNGALPQISLSVGVAFSDRKTPVESIFKDADKALYYTKSHGKCGCTIYSDITEYL